LELPTTANRDAIERAATGSKSHDESSSNGRFVGIGLGSLTVTGTVVKAQSINELMRRKDWPDSPVLVVEALEPSWAVVYSRFSAVVSELGGELSHAAILLREAELPSVINAPNVFHGLSEGDLVRVDPSQGEVVCVTEQGQEIETGPGRERVRHPVPMSTSASLSSSPCANATA
jgi:phosphohistidine swiveling domain-containing protein